MSFKVKAEGKVKILYHTEESEAVKTAIVNLQSDLKKVLPNVEILLNGDSLEDGIPQIIIRTINDSCTADTIGGEVLRDENGILHKETYQLRVSGRKLYITGADRRGTIYGIYTFCEWMGISPWYFFADVPVRRKEEIILEEGYCRTDWPSVEYRGIFINDEEELEAWVKNYLREPTIGVKSYEKIFELLLRLKANYIWPAMHVNSFNLNPENGELADRMGIVVGTSHCDMLMRSNNREWIPWINKKGYTDAVYDYSIEGRNREILQEYWKESVEQNRNYEVCYTLGMRGIHDSGFETRNLSGENPDTIRKAKVELLEKVITDQREILMDTLGRETMMTFIPYKEVLELYDNGLQIPEDMTLVWANDNYGYIRRYPSEEEKKRRGGNGIYYHNSYWAPPSMSYVFLCSIPLAHTRNELQKAWNEGIRKLWVLNCGAMKPLEQEITFFLRLAWEIGKPDALTEDVEAFVEDWIDHTFTGNMGKQVSVLLNDFSQLTNVRKIENMDYDAFSQTAYGDEAVMRIHRYEKLFEQGNALYEALPVQERAAFFQLVLMRIHAAYFTNLAYYYGDRSTLMYQRGNMQAAALYTQKSRDADDARRKLLYYYNHIMCDGKWNGILDPEGFPPPRAAMLPVCTPPLSVEGEPAMRVDVWNEGEELCFMTPGEKWIDIGNTGEGEFEVRIKAPEWVCLSDTQQVIRTEERVMIRVGDITESCQGEIVVENLYDGSIRRIPVRAVRTDYPEGGVSVPDADLNFCENRFREVSVEEDGIVALEADAADSEEFKLIRRLGRLQGNLLEAGLFAEGTKPLRYAFYTYSSGEFLLEIHRFPSLNSTGRIRIGISVDEKPAQIVESFSNDEWRGTWKKNVLNNVDRLYLNLPQLEAGRHELCVYAIDKYLAFSRILIYTKPRKENSLAGIRGQQALPVQWDMQEWCDHFYGQIRLRPRPTFYAGISDNDLDLTDRVVEDKCYGSKVEARWYLERGSSMFEEAKGGILIDAAAALAQSRFAWTEEPKAVFAGQDCIPEECGNASGVLGQCSGDVRIWRHCSSESFGRSGIALYIREPEMRWKAEEAPCLNYRISCKGGSYTVWMLSKFSVREEAAFSVGIDGEIIPPEKLYQKGCLWRYEAEQIYRWTPVTCLELTEGEHVLQIYSLASGMRYDRFYLTSGGELPPMDTEWKP